jgi:hypothetical protein
MTDVPLPEPLNEFLHNPPRTAAPQSLRVELLRQTSRQVRGRRVMRRVIALASLAAALLLTAVGVWLVYRPGPEQQDRQHAHHEDDVLAVEARAKPGPGPLVADLPKSPPPIEPQSAVALEWQAFDASPAEHAALYFQAGDRYLEEARDVASAMRCYNVAIGATPMQALGIQPDDNWLVATLKMNRIERQKEK